MELNDIIRRHFPSLNDLEFVQEFSQVAELKEIPAGEMLQDYGRRIERIPLLYEGSVQVFRQDEEGHEIFLYYLSPGDACAISLICSGHDKISRIRAETLENSKFIMAPVKYMDQWVMQHRVWYYFVLETYNYRFEQLLKTLDLVAFNRMDDRLEKFLLDSCEAQKSKSIQTTHQQIADSLFTSREVISRLLKQMENKGMIKLDRNRIDIFYGADNH